MSNKRATEDLLASLHSATAKHLLEKLMSGEATPSEVANAIRFLKDNGIEAVPSEEDKLHKILNALPTFNETDDDESFIQ